MLSIEDELSEELSTLSQENVKFFLDFQIKPNVFNIAKGTCYKVESLVKTILFM